MGVELICGVSFTSATSLTLSVLQWPGAISIRVNEALKVPAALLACIGATQTEGKSVIKTKIFLVIALICLPMAFGVAAFL